MMKRLTKNTTKKVKKAGRKEPAKKGPAKKITVKSSSEKGMKKQYLKTHPSCKVTFRLPKVAAPEAELVTIVGDFNEWNITETPMKKLKSGDFSVTVALPCNREYKFRYLIDTNKWENDWFADKYVPNEYGEDDSVVVIESNGC
jgi:1,4-alpha-glucan branching enzyme